MSSRFRIYAITGRGAGEKVRWTNTKLRKDHHELTERLLHRCRLGSHGLKEGDAAAFLEARDRFFKGA